MGLDIVELFMAVGEEFGVEIPNEMAGGLATVGALFDYVRTHLDSPAAGGAGPPYAGSLWERYLDVVVRDTGVRRDRLRPEAGWVRDLGLD